jgi:anaerobic magnesium-protoporphyrin IX monomethyl ester cyclase
VKVLLIDPPSLAKGSSFLNPGLGYVAASLASGSNEVRILDFSNNPDNLETRLKAALAMKPELIGFYLTAYTVRGAVEIAGKVRGICKPRMLVAGGPHVSLEGMGLIGENGVFDVGVVGEGEYSILDLCDVIEGRKDLRDVGGVIFRDDGEVKATPPRNPIEDLDKLPDPDYSNFDSIESMKSQKAWYPLVTSRGCPYSCSFCCNTITGGRWRARKAGAIVEELERVKAAYRPGGFLVMDDNFTQDIGRAKEFCTLLIEHNLGLPWAIINTRADRVDSELLSLAKKAGCESIGFGLESGDEDVLKLVGKGETIEQMRNGVALARDAGLKVSGSFVIGLPKATMQSERKSVEFAQNLRLDLVGFHHLVPYPKTPSFDWVKGNGRFLRDYSDGQIWGVGPKPIFETDDFSEGERVSAYAMWAAKFDQVNRLFGPDTHWFNRKVFVCQLLFRYNRRLLLKKILSEPGRYGRMMVKKARDGRRAFPPSEA